ncbi:MAG: ribose 5-phosphate isomerase B [Clostridia bacterium]|nr:ribose 5-phosphate isomerase B [Clostridia bacterium]
MKIAIGCDHGAYEMKEAIKAYLTEQGVTVDDKGTYSKDSVHYPLYAKAVCKEVQAKSVDFGILLCSTGIGISIAANKHKGIRAALCSDVYSAKFTRLHNDANVLCLGALVTGLGVAKMIVDTFLSTDFEGGRHQARVDMITAIEQEQ